MKSTDTIFDGLLVQRCRNGDKKAYALLVERWHQKFCKQAFWYSKDMDMAKDVAQDSWTTIFSKLNALNDVNKFGSWALSIVNRKAIDALRKKARTDEKLRAYYKNVTTNDTDYATHKITINDVNNNTNDHAKRVVKAIRKLPEDQQTVLRLFYVEDYTIIEISKILKVSKGTIKSRLFYAREKLKSILKNKNHEKS